MPVNRRHIVIVGGGFSGVALAVHLLRRDVERPRITLVEAGERIGRGLAYGTPVAAHLLNAGADQMSLFQDDPAHFLRWAQRGGHASTGSDFVPRFHYGRYLEDELQIAAGQPGACSEVLLQARVADIMRGLAGWIVRLEDGRRIACDDVVLATGNPAPADPLAAWLPSPTPRYLREAWRHASLAEIGPDDRILMIGTGLTMIDMLLSLESRGHRGAVHALSRRGLLPGAHPSVREALPDDLRLPLLAHLEGLDLHGLLQAVRQAMALAVIARGVGPQTVVDAMRPVVPRLWSRLSARDRRRFLRWLRPYWDATRHRAAPQVAAVVEAMKADGRLMITAGRLTGAEASPESIAIRRRECGHKDEIEERYDWVVNCTGPAFARGGGTLLDRKLLARGLIAPDDFGLGHRTDESGNALDGQGRVTGLRILGPACRARDWESTAVPELRRAAERMAVALATAPVTSSSPWYPDPSYRSPHAVHSRLSIA